MYNGRTKQCAYIYIHTYIHNIVCMSLPMRNTMIYHVFFRAMYLMFKQIDSLQPKLYVGFLCSGNGEFWTSFCRHWYNTWMVDGDHKMDAPFMDKYSGSLWKRGDVPRQKNWWWTDGFGIAAIVRQPPSFFQISLKCQLAWLPYIIPCWLPYIIPCYIPLLLIGNGKSHSIIPLIH